MTISKAAESGRGTMIDSVSSQEAATTVGSPPGDLLPEPFSVVPYDDLMTSLSVMMLRQKQDQRVAADQQGLAAAKAQEEAHARKIGQMRELADDTFMQGVVEGVFEGAGAIATAGAALTRYSSDMTEIRANATHDTDMLKRSKVLARDARLMDAASTGFSAGSKLGGGCARRAQELDREGMSTADAEIDRAKAAVEAASTDSRRAVDDIRETINAIRQYVAAQTQLANAAIIRG